ncbi:methylglyoxal synthase [Peredibacter starrii]|uniref:Methylglyoxal synthase n=1 Tax=Peredibacter starrii TaxID=28202 RepID=A0AAX4HVE6_9BACT|nr:methylglyoxal synthase [Peredibacter starrii]WPU66930.1 methylglyoxal synthase [Peredibacter starrii]
MKKNIALIAHDNLKNNMVSWAKLHQLELEKFNLFATGTTGKRVEEATGMSVVKFKSGPLGGDQQIGAGIAEGKIDAVIFFWDPLAPHPHDVDVKALLRIAVVYDIPMACNQKTADLLIQGLANS